MSSTGSSHRSRVRTVAPSCLSVDDAPSSRSSIGPCPMTATKLFARLEVNSGDFGATNGYPRNLDGWAAHPDGNTLAILATGPNSIGDGHVISKHCYITQCFGTVTDQIHAFQGRSYFSVLDQVAFGEREHEVTVRNVDLTAAERFCVNAAFYAGKYLFWVVRTRQEHGIGHARHGR